MLGEKEESEGGDIPPMAEENPSTPSCSLTHLSYEEQEDFWETLDVFITFTAELNWEGLLNWKCGMAHRKQNSYIQI